MSDTPDPLAVTPGEPIDLRALFSQDAEVEIEIGFGKGRFLIERSNAQPTSHLLGIEIRPKWAKLVQERCQRENLANVRVIAGNCLEIVPCLGPDSTVQRVFIHFPDPWWKRRHAKRKVVGETLVSQIARLLVPAGELFLQTDVEERAFEYLAVLRAHGGFKLGSDSGLVGGNPYLARSNREVQADKDGLPVYRILAQRAEEPPAIAIKVENGRF